MQVEGCLPHPICQRRTIELNPPLAGINLRLPVEQQARRAGESLPPRAPSTVREPLGSYGSQHSASAITEAAALLGDRPHALAKAGIVRPGRLVPHGHATAADGFTRPPFAHPEGASEMGNSFPLGRGRHHFFPKRSFKAALSSMASASNRFSHVFSSSILVLL